MSKKITAQILLSMNWTQGLNLSSWFTAVCGLVSWKWASLIMGKKAFWNVRVKRIWHNARLSSSDKFWVSWGQKWTECASHASEIQGPFLAKYWAINEEYVSGVEGVPYPRAVPMSYHPWLWRIFGGYEEVKGQDHWFGPLPSSLIN